MRVHALLHGLSRILTLAFCAFVVVPAHAQDAPRGDRPAPEKWQKLAPQADANGDGVLTVNEAKAFRKEGKKGKAQKSAAEAEGDAQPASPTSSDVSYGPHPRDILDFWKAESSGPTPVLIYYHGGSFKAGDKSNVLTQPVFEACLKAGISVVSANYRFSSDAPFPAPMLDGARAVQFVRFKAKEWNIDPERVALSGGSAGGTMALWIALHDDLADPRSADPVARESTRVRCVAAHGAPSVIQPDLIQKQTGARAVGGALAQLFGASTAEELETPEMKKLTADASPLTHASKDDPPLFVIYHGRPSDTPFPADAPQSLWIHHVCLGVPLKEKYDALGLEFQIFSQDNPAPEGAELRFLQKQVERDRE